MVSGLMNPDWLGVLSSIHPYLFFPFHVIFYQVYTMTCFQDCLWKCLKRPTFNKYINYKINNTKLVSKHFDNR